MKLFQPKQKTKRKRKPLTKRGRRIRAGLIVLAVIVGLVAFWQYGSLEYILDNSALQGKRTTRHVRQYRATIHKFTTRSGIADFDPVIEAIMMQETKGYGTDPMQASESPMNTYYSNAPNAIQDPKYSIKVGVEHFADCLKAADCTSPSQRSKLKLALQGYNFGNNYIQWAQKNYGGYSEANAKIFSARMKAKLGWNAYGDPAYAKKVMAYYDYNRTAASAKFFQKLEDLGL